MAILLIFLLRALLVKIFGPLHCLAKIIDLLQLRLALVFLLLFNPNPLRDLELTIHYEVESICSISFVVHNLVPIEGLFDKELHDMLLCVAIEVTQ